MLRLQEVIVIFLVVSQNGAKCLQSVKYPTLCPKTNGRNGLLYGCYSPAAVFSPKITERKKFPPRNNKFFLSFHTFSEGREPRGARRLVISSRFFENTAKDTTRQNGQLRNRLLANRQNKSRKTPFRYFDTSG